MSVIRRVGAREALGLMEDDGYLYVDVRSVPEFEAGHPAGAYNVPLIHAGPNGMTSNPDFERVMRAAFGPHQKLVLGCLAGTRSLRAAELLLAAGFSDVVDQRAGWNGVRDPFGQIIENGWQRERLPTASETEVGHGYRELEAKAG